MRFWMPLILAGMMALGTAGCDRQAAAPAGRFRVAMILPGSETDKGWNQMAGEALARIRDELGAETRLVSNVKSSEFGDRIDYFASEGFDVVICHGGEFESEAAKAARKFPRVSFIVGSCPNPIPDAVACEFTLRDASFLVGVVAAEVSRSRTIAFVGAMPVPVLQGCYDGMRDGAASADADVRLLPPLWTDSWDSPTRAKEKTESAISAGADVVFQNVDAAAIGVFEAVRDAGTSSRPVWAFGCNSNQNDLAPDIILGSVVLDVPRAYLELARDAKEGTLQRKHYRLGLEDGYVDLVLNEQHPQMTSEIEELVAKERRKLLEAGAEPAGAGR